MARMRLFVRRLQANEDAAYDELVRIYNSSIYHVAYRMLGDSAEASDAVQDIFLKVFEHRNLSWRCVSENVDLSDWDFRDFESPSLVEEAEPVIDGFHG